MKPILVIGTVDTKAEELGFLAEVLRARYPAVELVDVSTGGGAGADLSGPIVYSAPGTSNAVLQVRSFCMVRRLVGLIGWVTALAVSQAVDLGAQPPASSTRDPTQAHFFSL